MDNLIDEMEKITFKDVMKYYKLSKEELRDMCCEDSDLMYNLKNEMIMNGCKGENKND